MIQENTPAKVGLLELLLASSGVGLLEEYLKVFAGAAHDVGQFQIVQQIGRQLHHLVAMGSAEVDIIVEDGPLLAGIVEETVHLWTDDGVQGKVAAEEHDVVGTHLRIAVVDTVFLVVFVENVFGIVLLVEESQRERRLRLGVDVDIVGIDMIVAQKLNDVATHKVVARLADHAGLNAGAAQRHDGVERAATGYGTDGLSALENDVEHGLADSYYFSHILKFFRKDTKKS